MKNHRLALFASVVVLLALVAGLSAQHAQSATVDPSWEPLTGAVSSCSEDDVVISVEIVASSPASEKGVFSAPGFPNLGYTMDTNFTGAGIFNFTIFTDPYVVPANTPLTLEIVTYNGANFTGGISYIAGITWNCTTGEILDTYGYVPAVPEPVAVTEPVPGCDALIAIPSTAVGAKITADTLAYWKPGEATDTLLKAGTSVRAIGQENGWYEILFACDFLYVPVGTIGPNPESPWFNAPLP